MSDPTHSAFTHTSSESTSCAGGEPTQPHAPPPKPQFRDYELHEILGSGGMGVVYRATQKRLNRCVALKIIRPDRLTNPQSIERFRREAKTAAQLAHPNIVMVFDSAEEHGVPYLAMEYVKGVNLQQLIYKSGPLPVVRAAQLILQVASGLHHAYEQKLVHRDIKPQNLMLTHSGRSDEVVKILDMGLAKAFDGTDSGSAITQEGGVLGTADFIAPEQAEDARFADIRSDLYSLGCTLYFLLTGRVPFPGGTALQKLLRHRDEPPPDPRSIRPEISAEAVRILERLMSKKPQDRYRTPLDLQFDLREICQANMFQSGYRPVPRRMVSVDQLPPAGAEISDTDQLPDISPVATPNPLVEDPLESFLERFSDFLNKGMAVEARQLLQRLHREHPNHPKLVQAQSLFDRVFPSQRPLGELRCWRLHTAAVHTTAFGRDGCLVASGGADGLVRMWHALSGEPLGWFEGHLGAIWTVAIAADGLSLLSGGDDPHLRWWDSNTGTERAVFTGHTHTVRSAVFSPRGHTIASGADDGTVRLWHLDDAQQTACLGGDTEGVYQLAFTPTGQHLVVGCADETVRLYSLKSMQEICRLDAHGGHREAEPPALAFAADPTTVLTGHADGSPRLWNLRTNESLGRFDGGKVPVTAVAFSLDGERVLSGHADGSLRVWQVDGRKLLHTYTGHTASIRSVAFSPDSKRAVSGSDDRTVRLWRLPA